MKTDLQKYLIDILGFGRSPSSEVTFFSSYPITTNQLCCWLVMVSIKAEIYDEISNDIVMNWLMSFFLIDCSEGVIAAAWNGFSIVEFKIS